MVRKPPYAIKGMYGGVRGGESPLLDSGLVVSQWMGNGRLWLLRKRYPALPAESERSEDIVLSEAQDIVCRRQISSRPGRVRDIVIRFGCFPMDGEW